MVFVADDIGAWLVGLLADAGRKKLTTLVLGDEQQRALRRAATSAVLATVTELTRAESGQARQLAMVINEVFQAPEAEALTTYKTVLDGLQAGVTARLSVLDDASLTGTGQSSAEVLGVDAGVLGRRLAGHLVREIIERGARGGALAPLADQLNHDVTHLQGERLEGMLAGLSQEVRVALVQADGGTAARPVRLSPQLGLLAGREDLLAELDARLKRDGGARPKTAVLCGLGGVGKTSAAVEYAHRHQAELGVLWQFAAEDPATLAAGFGDLAALLHPGQPGDPVAVVHAVLAASHRDWLLIFDNAPSYAAVRAMLPPAGPGQVLITSQNPHWPGTWALNVPVLDEGAAAGFLQERTGQAETAAARELAIELGGLPLAVEQAAAYMLERDRTIAAYLDLFHQRQNELLTRGDPAGYDKNVTTTWALAFDQLQQTAPLAVGLLRLLACCAPELIPARLLLQPRQDLAGQVPAELAALTTDPLAADDAVAALRRFSLVGPLRDGMMSVHRLVQAITLAQLPDSEEHIWRQAAQVLIRSALPGDPQLSANWPDFAVLLPHAQAVIPHDTPAMSRIASFLGFRGNYPAARLLYQQITDAHIRSRGAEHPSTLTARADLAFWTGMAGDAAGARDQYAALIPLRERVSGAEHLATLTARSNLARWTGEAGDAAATRDQFAALVPIFELVSGAEHPQTHIARGNLAHYTGMAGDAAGARDQYAALISLRHRVCADLAPPSGIGARPSQHPDRPRQPCSLDWEGWGCGCRPGPVRCAGRGWRAGSGC